MHETVVDAKGTCQEEENTFTTLKSANEDGYKGERTTDASLYSATSGGHIDWRKAGCTISVAFDSVASIQASATMYCALGTFTASADCATPSPGLIKGAVS